MTLTAESETLLADVKDGYVPGREDLVAIEAAAATAERERIAARLRGLRLIDTNGNDVDFRAVLQPEGEP